MTEEKFKDRKRESVRARQRETERDSVRARKKETKRESVRARQRETERNSVRSRQRLTESDRESHILPSECENSVTPDVKDVVVEELDII